MSTIRTPSDFRVVVSLFCLFCCCIKLVAEPSCDGADAGPVGNWQGILTLEGVASTRVLPNVNKGSGYAEGIILGLPFAEGKLYVGPTGAGGINLEWLLKDGTSALGQIKFAHLAGGKAYHVAIEWDLQNALMRAFVNGVEQGDLLHGKAYASLMPAEWLSSCESGGELFYEDRPVASIKFQDVALSGTPVDQGALVEAVNARDLESIKGEFRRTYTEPLDIAPLKLTPVYSTTFEEREELIREAELLDESGQRVREPLTGQWVLEGSNIQFSQNPDGLRLCSLLPDNKRDGALVLWHNQELPGDFLIEYAFTPQRSDSGLNILFFNACASGGGSVFGLGQPVRNGRFREYIVGSIDNYHVSTWATDENRLRKSSNLRKNSGFKLLAIGDDRIGQHAPGKTHIVRVLKVDGRIKVETDGILVMEYEDPGTVHAPVLTGGIAGIRFMAHTGSVTIHHYKVFDLGE